ncbi:hypothetical protein ACFWRV_09495 [Streptomyces sp. NPDC058576]|uniref:hypothetical protein n=1 Tax=Streptomyces sp. NPDC058576 TaxID=3346547 RepID=UPI003654F7B8
MPFDPVARDTVETRIAVMEATGALMRRERRRLEWRTGTPVPGAAADLGNVPMAKSFERAFTMVWDAEKGEDRGQGWRWGVSEAGSRIFGGRRVRAAATVCTDVRRPSWKEARDMRANSRTTNRSTSLSRSRPVHRAVSDLV